MIVVRLLGTFEIKHGGTAITIASRPAQSLFAYLILNAGKSYRREKLAGMLWPESLEETARDNLRHALWRVRKGLVAAASAEILHADDLNIRFNESADYRLDVAQLENLHAEAPANELIAALSEYQGELLPGFYEEWVVLEREHIYSVFEHNMARLMALLQEEGRWLDILDWGERWIRLGQKPEPAYRALMSAHAAKGDMYKVTATYERCREALNEFGIAPSEQTLTLYERLKARRGPSQMPPVLTFMEKGKNAPRTNLPIPLTSFIGRENDVEAVMQLLGNNRLVTLTGAGGVGKTRLAIESSKRLLDKFKDGVWWVDLVGLNDPSLIPQVIARTLNVNEIPNRPVTETLIENTRRKQLLLVLDNCEHLIKACAGLADQLLTGCEDLKILATSREALDVLGETAWRVPSLSVPGSQEDFSIKALVESESIRLFTERAGARRPQFSLTYQNARAVVQICDRLDGIPLAIELAAARVKMMSVDEIARRLDERFDLLTAGNRSAPLRHQTLRAAIDWSHDLLTKSEQALFRRLSIFAAGFALDAAEAVCEFGTLKRDHVLPLLGRLVDKSLVFFEPAPRPGQTRYRLLETIREYALEKLSESGEERVARDHHMEFFSQLAIRAEPKLLGAEAVEWARQLDTDHDNLLAAIDWSLKSENPDFAMQIVGALIQWDAWHNREGADRSLKVVQSPLTSRSTPLRAKALQTAGLMQMFQGNFSQARALLEEAISIGHESQASENYVWALSNLGSILAIERDFSTARAYLEEAIAAADPVAGFSLGWSLAYLGDICLFQDDREQAGRMYEQSVARLRELENRAFLAYPLRRLADLALDHMDHESAVSLCRESLKLNMEGGDERAILASLVGFAAIASARGQVESAVRLLAAVRSLLGATSASLLTADQQAYDRNLALLRPQLDGTSFDIAWAEGSELTMEQAIELALAEPKGSR